MEVTHYDHTQLPYSSHGRAMTAAELCAVLFNSKCRKSGIDASERYITTQCVRACSMRQRVIGPRVKLYQPRMPKANK